MTLNYTSQCNGCVCVCSVYEIEMKQKKHNKIDHPSANTIHDTLTHYFQSHTNKSNSVFDGEHCGICCIVAVIALSPFFMARIHTHIYYALCTNFALDLNRTNRILCVLLFFSFSFFSEILSSIFD